MDGFFKVVRGVNNINIEGDCDFGVPLDTWTDKVKHLTTDEEKNDPNNDQVVYTFPQPEFKETNTEFLSESTGCRVKKATFKNGEMHKTQRSWLNKSLSLPL